MHRTAPHRTALHHLLTRWQPGPHAERHLRYTCLKVLSLTPHCTARYATCVRTCTNIGKVTTPRQRQQKRQREMDTERGQRKSRGQLLRLCSPSQRKLRARHLTPLQLPVTLSLPPLLLLSLLSPQGVSPHRHLSDSSIPLAYPTPA
ncbi:hypothetical protein CMEL01_14429 [Colletotrichum melonis]|uniref:Uncharacterized protein n=1 Tax=Colletotrichum melonis TaxID=1209925 RepID=A0AAI9XVU3_9PEZI|nr:hypothetical protein CMEL01_14429 [Colletotrichum melonis]